MELGGTLLWSDAPADSKDNLQRSFPIAPFNIFSAWLHSAVDKTPNVAVTDNSCRLEMVSLRAQIPATWCNYPLWNSGVRGQLSLPIFVTFQSSVSWWQLCYPSILSLPPPPPLLELRRKPSAELAFRRFFFLNTNFPLFRSNLQSGFVSAGFDERLVLCFTLPEERLPTCFSFWFDSLPFCGTVRGCSCHCQLWLGDPLFF